MAETAICRECGNYVPVSAAAKGPDLDQTVICVECWPVD